jgi:thiamine pyrophosphokinase
MKDIRAVILANGEIENLPALKRVLQPKDFLVAVDGGLRHLKRLGLKPDLLIGDLDSVIPEDVRQLEREGVEIMRFPVEKDQTDLELALKTVIDRGFWTVRIAAALGGRLDQALANIFLLLYPSVKEKDIRLDDGHTEVFIIKKQMKIQGKSGDTISLIPILGPVTGIITGGLKYPLRSEELFPDHTRGISNVLLKEEGTVQISSGTLLCIHIRSKSPI